MTIVTINIVIIINIMNQSSSTSGTGIILPFRGNTACSGSAGANAITCPNAPASTRSPLTKRRGTKSVSATSPAGSARASTGADGCAGGSSSDKFLETGVLINNNNNNMSEYRALVRTSTSITTSTLRAVVIVAP